MRKIVKHPNRGENCGTIGACCCAEVDEGGRVRVSFIRRPRKSSCQHCGPKTARPAVRARSIKSQPRPVAPAASRPVLPTAAVDPARVAREAAAKAARAERERIRAACDHAVQGHPAFAGDAQLQRYRIENPPASRDVKVRRMVGGENH